MKRLLLAVLILATAGVGADFTQIHQAHSPEAEAPVGVGPQGCFPVDGDDVAEDRVYGERETLDDEGEIACVNRAKFRAIRRQLGLKP